MSYDTTGATALPDDWIAKESGVRRTTYDKPSEVVAAFDKRIALEKSNPLLALAYLVEATDDLRTMGGQDAYSKLAALGANARRLLRAAGHLEKAYDLYPLGGDNGRVR